MTDLPPTVPPSYDGDYSRPLDPQFVDPQYGRHPYYPPYATPPYATAPASPTAPPPPPPRAPLNRNLVVLGLVGGLVAVVVLFVVLLAVSGPEDSTEQVLAPPSVSAPSTPSTPAPSLPSSLPPDLQATAQATVVGVRYFDALRTKDRVELQSLTCSGATIGSAADLARIASAVPSSAATITGTTATMDGSVLLDDGTGYELQVTLQEQGASWCVLRDRKR